MEKHIKIFCEKKPTIEVKCDVCNKSMKIKTSELLKVKYEYKGTCPHCGCPVSAILEGNNDDATDKLFTIINGEKKDVTKYVAGILKNPWLTAGTGEFYKKLNLEIIKELDVPMIGFVEAVTECHGAPKEYNATTISSMKEKQQAIQASKIKCPNCHSTDVKRISGTERVASVVGLGLFSKKINKTYKCKNCKCTW